MTQTKREYVFITGAGAGIGLQIAKLFAKNGCFVGIYDIDEASAQAALEDVGTDNGCCGAVDVVDADSVRAALDDFSGHSEGRLDILVNNAGIIAVKPFEEIDLERHQQIIDVNAKGVVNCTHLAFPLLRDTPGARVLSLASASASFGIADFASYSATKFFVRGLTEALNIEWKRHDIFVCDIWPPFVKTAMLEGLDDVASVQQMGVNLIPEDVAKVAWGAAHGTTVHTMIGAQFKLVNFIWSVAPYAIRRRVAARLTGY